MSITEDERNNFLDAAFVETVESLPEDEQDLARQIFMKCRPLFLAVSENFTQRVVDMIVEATEPEPERSN